jgi:hypothetical protein
MIYFQHQVMLCTKSTSPPPTLRHRRTRLTASDTSTASTSASRRTAGPSGGHHAGSTANDDAAAGNHYDVALPRGSAAAAPPAPGERSVDSSRNNVSSSEDLSRVVTRGRFGDDAMKRGRRGATMNVNDAFLASRDGHLRCGSVLVVTVVWSVLDFAPHFVSHQPSLYFSFSHVNFFSCH